MVPAQVSGFLGVDRRFREGVFIVLLELDDGTLSTVHKPSARIDIRLQYNPLFELQMCLRLEAVFLLGNLVR